MSLRFGVKRAKKDFSILHLNIKIIFRSYDKI